MDRVPVLLDAISDSDNGGGLIARCTYFHIEVEDTLDGWVLNNEIPFLMVGLAGILLAPSVTERRFNRVRQLGELIEAIEAGEGRSVETADVWLPARFIPHRRETPRGEVLRVDPKLFLIATAVRAGGLNFAEAFASFPSEGLVEASPEETRVFAGWSKMWISDFGHWFNQEQPPPRRGVEGTGG